MAKQSSYIRLQGDVGGVTFFERGGKFFARQTRTVNPDAIKSDPAFERTRENNAEFTRAAKAAKLVLTAFRNATAGATDGRVYTRLLRQTMRGIKADPVSDRGQRNIVNGEPGFIQGFNFNDTAELTAVFKPQFSATVDRAGGTVTVSIPSFIPSRMTIAPEGASHLRLIAAGSEVDFETNEYISNLIASAEVKIDNNNVAAQSLELLLPPGSNRPLVVVFGIEFVQTVNGKYYSLKNGAYNSFSIVAVNTPQ